MTAANTLPLACARLAGQGTANMQETVQETSLSMGRQLFTQLDLRPSQRIEYSCYFSLCLHVPCDQPGWLEQL